MANWHIGQEIVCIKSMLNQRGKAPVTLTEGHTFRIRDISLQVPKQYVGMVGFQLDGVPTYNRFGNKFWYLSRWFRPVTNIEIFTDMLKEEELVQ